MNYEKNISTEQDKKKEISWIPCKDGNTGRQTCYSKKKTERTSPVNSVSFSFKKEMHVRKKWEFRKIRSFGSKYYGKFVCFQYVIDSKSPSKLGLTVSKKYGNAIQRNFFKRRMRELFRVLYPKFANSINVNILPLNAGKEASYLDLQADWENFII